MVDEEPSETGGLDVKSLSLCDDSFGDFTEAAASGSDSEENELEQEIDSSQRGNAGTEEPSSVEYSVCDPEEYLKNTFRDTSGLDADQLVSSLDRLSVEDLMKEIDESDGLEDKYGHVLKRQSMGEVKRHPWKGSFFEIEMMGRLGLQRIAESAACHDIGVSLKDSDVEHMSTSAAAVEGDLDALAAATIE
jgi:hypothetical protein